MSAIPSFTAGSSLLHWPDDLPAFAPYPPSLADEMSAGVSPLASTVSIPADLPAWIARFKQAHVTAHRIASPNFLSQLDQARNTKIDAVICTLLDGDPALRLNAALAAHFAPALTAAVRLLIDLTSARRGWIVSDATTPPDWLAPLRAPARSLKLRMISLRNDYPQSDPTLLLYTLLGRRLKPADLPPRRGVLLIDAATAIAIGQLLMHNQPRRQTPFACHDHANGRAHYLSVRTGTRIADVLTHLGMSDKDCILRAADPLRDIRVSPDSTIDDHELTLHHISPPDAPVNPAPCIRCGWCIEGCPTRIQPAGLLEAAQRNDPALAKKNGLDACIQCGICSYVCPSQLPLLTAIRTLLH